jgi:hypothetical protein
VRKTRAVLPSDQHGSRGRSTTLARWLGATVAARRGINVSRDLGGGQVPSMTCPTAPRPVTRRAAGMIADLGALMLRNRNDRRRDGVVRCVLVWSGVVPPATARPAPASPGSSGSRHAERPPGSLADPAGGIRMIHNGRPPPPIGERARRPSIVRALLDQPGGLPLGPVPRPRWPREPQAKSPAGRPPDRASSRPSIGPSCATMPLPGRIAGRVR